jgi:hypothetical protein
MHCKENNVRKVLDKEKEFYDLMFPSDNHFVES